jgi:hypothetical protein
MSNTAHEALCDEAKEAIDAVHADSSVSQQETVDSLNDIIGHAEMLRDVVQSEIDGGSEAAADGDDS